MFSSFSLPAFNFNYYEDYYERRKVAIHDVDCFIIDYMERHFPAILEISAEQIRSYKYGIYQDVSDIDLKKIAFLQSIHRQAKEGKELAMNNHKFLMGL